MSAMLIFVDCSPHVFFSIFFPQHLVEGLLNSQRRVSDRPSWILISMTPARKPTKIVILLIIYFCFPNKKINNQSLAWSGSEQHQQQHLSDAHFMPKQGQHKVFLGSVLAWPGLAWRGLVWVGARQGQTLNINLLVWETKKKQQ